MNTSAFGTVLALTAWDNFYVILGSSAATLTGLTFVVVTLSTERNSPSVAPAARMAGLRAFITPIAIHFSAALWISAMLTIPGQTALSLALCLGAGGLVGIAFTARVIYLLIQIRPNYQAFVADWIWSAVLPLIAYLCLLSVAFVLLAGHVAAALYGIAGITVLLVFLGIHNAWDVVVWLTTERHAHPARQRQEAHPNPAESRTDG